MKMHTFFFMKFNLKVIKGYMRSLLLNLLIKFI